MLQSQKSICLSSNVFRENCIASAACRFDLTVKIAEAFCFEDPRGVGPGAEDRCYFGRGELTLFGEGKKNEMDIREYRG